ncbi:MAG: TIGR03943 family protein [Verrucomicrobiota bacterium]
MKNSTFLQGLRDSLLLLLWGVFVLWLSFSGQLSTYLHPSLQPYTSAAGVIFLLLAFFGFRSLFTLQVTHEHHEHHGHHECCGNHLGHDHAEQAKEHQHHGAVDGMGAMIFKTILLLLPLAIIVSGKATAYSITTIYNRGVVDNINKLPSAKAGAAAAASAAPFAKSTASVTTVATSDASSSALASSGGPMPLQVIDMLYAVQMPSYREEFEGKEVELIGQYIPMTTGNPKGDRFQAIRMFITCCAADAKPVGVTVEYPKPLKVSEMGWVKITGKPTFPMEGGRRTAVLNATKVEECPAPSEPFVY